MTGVGDFLNRKHSHPGGNENDAPTTRQDLLLRQAAVQKMGFKVPVSGIGLRGQSISGSGLPVRDAIAGPARTGSPHPIQQAVTQNAFANQDKDRNNGQGQAYAQADSQLWPESTLGSDSVDTVRDGSFVNHDNPLNVDHDHEPTYFQTQRNSDYDQGIRLSRDIYESDSEAEGFEPNHHFQRMLDTNAKQPGVDRTNIPMRGGHTRRFGSGPQIQQQQPVATAALFPNGKSNTRGTGQPYNQNQIPGRLGQQLQDEYNQQQHIDRFAPSDIDEDTIHSTVGNGFHSNANGDRENSREETRISSKRQAENISDQDYDNETLYNMPYEVLKKQPFDEDPNRAEPSSTPSPIGPTHTLDERLEQFKNQSGEAQIEFLSTLSIEEWEQAGEWLLKQFGTVMSKIVDARQMRRRIATEFEKRIAARDAEVNEAADSVATALQELKHGGQNLLRGRTPT